MIRPSIDVNTLPLKKLPSVMALRRCVIVSDAPLNYINQNGEVLPVPVIQHGTMGTQNVNEDTNPGGVAADGVRNVANLQGVQTAKTPSDMQKVQIGFQMRVLDMAHGMHSCSSSSSDSEESGKKMRAFFDDFVERSKHSAGMAEVCRRFARNICNGRWLWRNRLAAQHIAIEVHADGRQFHVPDALNIPLNHFDDYSDTEIALGDVLHRGLRGEDVTGLIVTATIDYGVTGSIEVFCSQNYEPESSGRGKPDAKVSRSLYKLANPRLKPGGPGMNVLGQAAYRDAKIWNAIRSIDTWYSNFEETGLPIAIEPQGASLALMEFLRSGKTSAFALFRRLNQIDPDSPEGMFCIAVILRGGVFGEAEEKSGKKSKTADAATPEPEEEYGE